MKKFEIVEIAGKKLPVAFNRYALGELMDDLGLSLEDFSNIKESLKTVQKFAYYGLVGGYAAKHEKQFEMSYMKACIELFGDDVGLAKIMDVWAKHQPAPSEVEEKEAKGEGKP